LRRKAALLAPALAVMLAAAACGGSSDDNGNTGGGDGARKGGTLTYGFADDFPPDFNPDISAGNLVSIAYLEIRILPAPFHVKPDFTYQYDNELLTAEPTSETVGGKQVVTYKISPNAVWSDGDPIDAKDFAYTWSLRRSADPASGGCAAMINTSGYDQVAAVEGSDSDKTVKVTFAKPYSDWKGLFAGPGVLPAHLLDKGSPKENCALSTAGWKDGLPNEISGGAWQLKKSNIDKQKQTMVLTPNEKYWGKKPNLDRLIYVHIGQDSGTNVKAMKNGDVQMVYPQAQPDLVKNFKSLEPKIVNKISFGLTFEHMDFNTKNFHLAQPLVRKAIATALDRPSLVKATAGVFDPRAQVLNNRIYVNNQPQYKDNSGGLYTKGDVAKAVSMLQQAGYTKGPDGIMVKEGKRLSLEMMTTVGNQLRETTIDIVAQQLKPAGIEIKKYLNPDLFAGPEKPRSLAGGQFDIGLFAWVASPAISPNTSIYATPKSPTAIGQNYSRGGDPKVDDLLTKMSQETDPTKAADLANQVDSQLWQDVFTLPLYQKATFLAYDSNFTGIGENATTEGPLWNSPGFALKQ